MKRIPLFVIHGDELENFRIEKDLEEVIIRKQNNNHIYYVCKSLEGDGEVYIYDVWLHCEDFFPYRRTAHHLPYLCNDDLPF